MSLFAPGNIANLNNDPNDNVDFNDLCILINCWSNKDIPTVEDLKGDGITDFYDYTYFANY